MSKPDIDRLVLHLKDIMNSSQPAFTLLFPLDYATALGELIRWRAVREQARDTLMRMHEAGMIDLSDYKD